MPLETGSHLREDHMRERQQPVVDAIEPHPAQ
jgi:hypothetical protein